MTMSGIEHALHKTTNPEFIRQQPILDLLTRFLATFAQHKEAFILRTKTQDAQRNEKADETASESFFDPLGVKDYCLVFSTNLKNISQRVLLHPQVRVENKNIETIT